MNVLRRGHRGAAGQMQSTLDAEGRLASHDQHGKRYDESIPAHVGPFHCELR